jgi:hypothetical protein
LTLLLGPDHGSTKTINRISAMTLIIPIKQGFTAPLVFGQRPGDPHSPPYWYDEKAPPVRYVNNLNKVFSGTQYLAASGQTSALNQIATIHYARWVVFDDEQKLLFSANYDTSLDQYLRDFMEIGNVHPTPEDPNHIPWMDLVWGPLQDYPGSQVDEFIAWARSWEIDTTFFFPTISDVTVRDISWLVQFKHFFDEFEKELQWIPIRDWPPELLEKFERFKKQVNDIEVQVVPRPKPKARPDRGSGARDGRP